MCRYVIFSKISLPPSSSHLSNTVRSFHHVNSACTMFTLLQYPLCHSQSLQKVLQSKHPLFPSESSSSPVSLVLHLGGGFPKYPNNQLTDNRFFMEKSPQKNWWIPLTLYQQSGKIIESSFKSLHLWEKWSRTLPISPFCRLPKSHPVVLLPPFHRVVLIFVDSATWHEVLRWKKQKMIGQA